MAVQAVSIHPNTRSAPHSCTLMRPCMRLSMHAALHANAPCKPPCKPIQTSPVGRQVPLVLVLQLLHEDVPRVVAPRDEQLAVVEVEHATPRQQERGLLVAKDRVAEVDQALEGLALLELALAVLGLVAARAEAAADLVVFLGEKGEVETCGERLSNLSASQPSAASRQQPWSDQTSAYQVRSGPRLVSQSVSPR
jgi:hypothetical protein